jgi:hypothetical protein
MRASTRTLSDSLVVDAPPSVIVEEEVQEEVPKPK